MGILPALASPVLFPIFPFCLLACLFPLRSQPNLLLPFSSFPSFSFTTDLFLLFPLLRATVRSLSSRFDEKRRGQSRAARSAVQHCYPPSSLGPNFTFLGDETGHYRGTSSHPPASSRLASPRFDSTRHSSRKLTLTPPWFSLNWTCYRRLFANLTGLPSSFPLLDSSIKHSHNHQSPLTNQHPSTALPVVHHLFVVLSRVSCYYCY